MFRELNKQALNSLRVSPSRAGMGPANAPTKPRALAAQIAQPESLNSRDEKTRATISVWRFRSGRRPSTDLAPARHLGLSGLKSPSAGSEARIVSAM